MLHIELLFVLHISLGLLFDQRLSVGYSRTGRSLGSQENISEIHIYNSKFLLKISNTFLFLFLNKMLGFRAGIYKMLVSLTNREDPDHTASSELLCPNGERVEVTIILVVK